MFIFWEARLKCHHDVNNFTNHCSCMYVCTSYIDGWKPSMSHLSSAVDTNDIPGWESFQSVSLMFCKTFIHSGLEYQCCSPPWCHRFLSKVYFCFELEGRQTWREAVVRNLRFLFHTAVSQFAPCKLCSARLSPVSWLLNSPAAASLLRVQCSVPGPRPAKTRSRIKLFRAGPPAS